jgi:hypothetical protein
MRLSVSTAPLIVGLLLTGCGGGNSHIEKVVPVSGVLTFRGKALEYYQVTFTPDDGRRPAIGVTDAAGKFTLGTNDVGDGAPPGVNKVSVAWVGPPQTTEAGSEVIIDDPSKLPKPKFRIPEKYSAPETTDLTQDVPSSGISDLKIDLK